MENFNIENAKTRFFESKEHYLKFRQAWKDFHNSDKLVWREDEKVYSWALRKDVIMRNVKHTSLGAEHYMIYNLLRGYGINYGFIPLQDTEEHLMWAARDAALYKIYSAAKRLQYVNGTAFSRDGARKSITDLLLPFGDTVSHKALSEIGEWINTMIYNNHNWPQFEIEEWKSTEPSEKDRNSRTLKDKLRAWRTA